MTGDTLNFCENHERMGQEQKKTGLIRKTMRGLTGIAFVVAAHCRRSSARYGLAARVYHCISGVSEDCWDSEFFGRYRCENQKRTGLERKKTGLIRKRMGL
jgi:hypothetical protein